MSEVEREKIDLVSQIICLLVKWGEYQVSHLQAQAVIRLDIYKKQTKNLQ